MEEDDRAIEKPQEKGIENATPQGPAVAPEKFREGIEVPRPTKEYVWVIP